MQKFYSIVLMAAALLIGTNAWAANYTIGDGGDFADLAALKTAMDNGTVTLSDADEITANANLDLANGVVYDFGGATIILGSYLNASNKTAYYYVSGNASKANFTVKNVIIKNGKSSGAIYISAGASVTLENVTAVDCNYGLFTKTAKVTLNNFDATGATTALYVTKLTNIPAEWHLTGVNYGLRYNSTSKLTNNGTIDGIFVAKACEIENHGIINKGVAVAASLTSVSVNNVSGAEFTQTDYTVSSPLTINDATIMGGTFAAQLSGTGISVQGGTFSVAPADDAEGTIEGECKFPAGPALGGLTVGDGFKAFSTGYVYAYVSPGPVVILTHNHASQTFESLEEAFAAAADGDEISLNDDVTICEPIKLGTASVNGTPRSLTLDLNGHSITSKWGVAETFTIYHGALKVINSVPGEGGIYNTAADGNAFRLYGSYLKNCNPRIQTPFTHLTIEEGVDVYAQNNEGSGISVNEMRDTYQAACGTDYTTDVYNNTTEKAGKLNGYGVANGVRVDVKGHIHADKYGLKVNGSVRYPDPALYGAGGSTDAADIRAQKAYFAGYEVLESDTAFAPYVRVYSSAVIEAANTAQSAAAYSSGYGRWLIEGTCQGANGLYIKSGAVALNDATIESTWSGQATDVITGKSSGIEGSGNAITVESNKNYSGETVLVVAGDTKISSEADGGSALYEVVDVKADGSKVESIEINGGSFSGGENGYAISISTTTAADPDAQVVVYGTTVEGGVTVGTVENLDPILADNSHITEIKNEDGSTTIIVSQGTAPTAKTEWTDVAALAAGSDAKWTGFTPGVIGDGTTATTVTLGELQIISGNATDGVQQLTIMANATLKVDKLIMNDYARIIVEAGAKLIVEGEQGINAPVVDNILLKASEDKQALFLFNPAVTSNRHPNAKVEYHSNSFFSDHNIQQFFGIPTYNGGVTNIETTSAAAIYFDIWRNPGWDYVGAINVPVTPADPSVLDHLDKFNLPFALCCITSKNNIDNKPVFTFSGELTGNMDHTFTLQKGWTSMANAYMGPIDKNAIIAQLAAWNANYGTEQSVYTYDLNAATGAIQWHARNKFAPLPEKGLNAMQPMMFHNGSKVEGIILDYSTLVWDPFVNASLAPARRQATNHVTQAQINIVGENEVDYITVVADSELENDRSFCAPKYDNAGLQLYVTGDEKYDVFAADVIENSYIGYRTVNAGMYTISFENVRGENLVLVDLVNGACTNITEGAIYTFRADANESNDYRFQIVTPAKTPTSIDNTDAAANNKKAGVYTLTGQYLGNASVFNALPAGVYVVDGVKKVK